MHLISTLASMLGVSALTLAVAAPQPDGYEPSLSLVFMASGLSVSRTTFDNAVVSIFSFELSAGVSNSAYSDLHLICSPYDPIAKKFVTGAAPENGKIYPCNSETGFTFAYTAQAEGTPAKLSLSLNDPKLGPLTGEVNIDPKAETLTIITYPVPH